MTTIQELRGKRNYVQVRDRKIPDTSSGFEREFYHHLSYRNVTQDLELGTFKFRQSLSRHACRLQYTKFN